MSIGVESWSALLPGLSQTAGNYDGFNYLGMGVLLFGAFGLGRLAVGLVREKRLREFLGQYRGLLLFLVFVCFLRGAM